MYKIHVPDKQIHINKLPMCHMPSVESFKSTQLTRVEREMFILSDFHSSIWVRSTSHLKTEWKLHGQYWSSSCSTRNSSPSSTISYLIQQFIFSATDLQYLLFLDQIYQSESRSYEFWNVLSARTFVQKLYCIYCTWKAFPQCALSCGSAEDEGEGGSRYPPKIMTSFMNSP